MANTVKKYVSLDKLSLYNEKINKVITDADAATLASAKSYADGLAVNYDAAGAAATAESNAKAYADGKDAAIQAAADAAAAAATAAATADGKAVAAQGEVDALETYVGTFTHDTAKSVVEYINAKTDGIATSGNLEALGTRVTAVEGDVATIKGDYLKAADKTELEGEIEDVQGAVDAEKERAMGIEGGLETRLAAVESDYLKAADKTELQNNINTVSGAVERLTNGVSAEEIDGVNDLIQYVKDHGTEVTGMQEDIGENTEAIAGVAGRMDTAEGNITALQGAVATKVEQEAYDTKIAELVGVDTGLDNRLKAVEALMGDGDGSVADQIADVKSELQGEMATAIEGAKTDASNKDAVVLAEAQNATAAVQSALDTHTGNGDIHVTAADKVKWNAAADVTSMAHQHSNYEVLEGITSAKVTAWDGAEQAAKTYADGLNTAMNTRVQALESWHENFVECSQEDINGLFA